MLALVLAAATVAIPSASAAPAATPAPTCDSKGLSAALTEAGPNQAGQAYTDLAACDAKAATAATPAVFGKVIAGEGGNTAAKTALLLNQGGAVRSWIIGMDPSDRSTAINLLGQSCKSPGVPAFFTDTATAVGPKFWGDGWYKGLDECREPAAQEILRARINEGVGTDRNSFFGALEVYAKNVGKDAMPTLNGLLNSQTDAEVLGRVISSYADVAKADPSATTPAVEAIVAAAPKLPDIAIEQARSTLLSLAAEEQSDALVLVRYKNALQADGSLLYGVVMTETATCKKGDVRVEVHSAMVNGGNTTWPDQFPERVKAATAGAFGTDLGTRCKGTGKQEFATPDAPFANKDAYEKWVEDQVKAVEKANPAVKPKAIEREPLSI